MKRSKAAAPSSCGGTASASTPAAATPPRSNWPHHFPRLPLPLLLLLLLRVIALLAIAQHLHLSSPIISRDPSRSTCPRPAMHAILFPPAISFAALGRPAALPSPGAPPSSLSSLRSGAVRPSAVRRMQRASSLSPSSSPATEEATPSSMAGKWAQKTVVIPAQRRGCHLVTSRILKEIEQDLSGFKCGLAHFFLQHTSASLTINENYDSDVQDDTETFLNRIVPEGRSAPWKHTLEGPDDMPAHIKSSMFGCALTIPITNGRLNMGTWQGIWICEHRDHATPRKIVVTLNGM